MNTPDYQTPRALRPPNPHHFPPAHESKSPSSPCHLTVGKEGESRGGAEGWTGCSEGGGGRVVWGSVINIVF